MEQSKRCGKCKQLQPLSEYHKQAKSKDGLQDRCKACKREAGRLWRADWRSNNREAHRAEVKAFREADPARAKAMRRRNYEKNKDKELATMAVNYQNNKELRQQQARERYQANPIPAKQAAARRRAKMQDNGIYEVSDKEWAKLELGPCFYCGSTESIEIDHIIPIDRGGAHSIGNLMPLCLIHNRSKHTKLWIEFRVKEGKSNAKLAT